MFRFFSMPWQVARFEEQPQDSSGLHCVEILISVYSMLAPRDFLADYDDDEHNKDVVWIHTEGGKKIPLTLDKTFTVDRMYDNKKTAGVIVQRIRGNEQAPWGAFAMKAEIPADDHGIIKCKYAVASPEYVESATSFSGSPTELFRKVEELEKEVARIQKKYDKVLDVVNKYARANHAI